MCCHLCRALSTFDTQRALHCFFSYLLMTEHQDQLDIQFLAQVHRPTRLQWPGIEAPTLPPNAASIWPQETGSVGLELFHKQSIIPYSHILGFAWLQLAASAERKLNADMWGSTVARELKSVIQWPKVWMFKSRSVWVIYRCILAQDTSPTLPLVSITFVKTTGCAIWRSPHFERWIYGSNVLFKNNEGLHFGKQMTDSFIISEYLFMLSFCWHKCFGNPNYVWKMVNVFQGFNLTTEICSPPLDTDVEFVARGYVGSQCHTLVVHILHISDPNLTKSTWGDLEKEKHDFIQPMPINLLISSIILIQEGSYSLPSLEGPGPWWLSIPCGPPHKLVIAWFHNVVNCPTG